MEISTSPEDPSSAVHGPCQISFFTPFFRIVYTLGRELEMIPSIFLTESGLWQATRLEPTRLDDPGRANVALDFSFM